MKVTTRLLAILAVCVFAGMPALAIGRNAQTSAEPEAAATSGALQPQIFYQIFFRSFRASDSGRIGDLKGLTSKLHYIKHLGATTILLTPLQPSPYYHNYFATAFKAIDPAYGTMAEYFAFVRAAHALGLKVYLDEEFQYVAQGNPWWTTSICKPHSKYANYLLWKDASHCIAQPMGDRAKWRSYTGKEYGIAMVNLDNPAVRAYFQKLLLFWADPNGKCDSADTDGVDGFRLDHMMDDLDHKGLDTHLFADFWTPIITALKQCRPNLGILAEQADWGYGRKQLTEGHADMVFAFPLRGAIVSLNKQQIVNTIRATAAATPPNKKQVVFLENHDLDRFMSLVHDNQAKARAGAAIEFMLQGDPLIYYGQELGMRGMHPQHMGKSGGIPLSDAYGIPSREAFRWDANLKAPGSAIWYLGAHDQWANKWWWKHRYNRSDDGVSLQAERNEPHSLYHWYLNLTALWHSHIAMREGEQRLVCAKSPNVLCILREDGSQRVLLLVNLGKSPAQPQFGSGLPRGARWHELLDSATPTSDVGAVLQPMQVRIFGTTDHATDAHHSSGTSASDHHP